MKPYWTSEIYGFGKWIRKYAFYPKSLPLCIYTDHGVSLSEQTAKHELESDAPTLFFHWDVKVKEFRKNSKKPCFTLYSPFVFARKFLKIEQTQDSQGAVFFLGHSTDEVIDQRSVEIYYQELGRLPEKFNPITICLHIHDVNRGLNKTFEKLGYTVVTAGDSSEEDFTERFYNILSKHKYAISNLVGSYAFYSIEMNIPFGLYGTPPDFFNYSDPNIELGEYTSYKELNEYKKALLLFSRLPDKVTEEQRKFVEEHLGLQSQLNRVEMSIILYKSFLLWLFDLIKQRTVLGVKGLTRCCKYFVKKTILRNKVSQLQEDVLLKETQKASILTTDAISQLSCIPRYKHGEVMTKKGLIKFVDSCTLIEGHDEIFVNNIYKFCPSSDSPLIIDCGANIGLASIYFKGLWPNATIIAFEPDPFIFQCLTYNLKSLGFDNKITLNQSAVWIHSKGVSFDIEGGFSGQITKYGHIEVKQTIKVPSIKLKDVISNNDKIDLLKIDIEGAEFEVLNDIFDVLDKIDHIFIEYHSHTNESQKLGKILCILSDNSFRYHITPAYTNAIPFINRETMLGMDLQLNIFAYRN